MPPEDKIKLYDQLIAALDKVERKGKTTPYTAVNGNMFSFLDKTGTMGLRLAAEDRHAFIEKYESQLMEQHGRQMKEYVLVPANLLMNTAELLGHLKASYDYTMSLKPKASKKKK